MINLLPDDSKKEIQAARVNVILLRYNLVVLGAFAGLAAICMIFYLILFSNQTTANSTSTSNQKEVGKYAKVQIAADTYRSNLKTANEILDRGVNYTSFIVALTETLPAGVIIDNIDLSADDFGKQITFTAKAESYDKAIEMKEKFQSSTRFSNVHFNSLTDSSGSQGANPVKYPIAITISVLLCNGICADKQQATNQQATEQQTTEAKP